MNIIFFSDTGNVTFQCRSSFIFRLKNKVIFLGKMNTIFPDNTRHIILQCNFLGNIIFSEHLGKENVVFSAVLIVLDDMIANTISNKKINPVITELLIRGRKLNISRVFVTILFFRNKNSQTKFYTLFYFEHFKQMRALKIAINYLSDIEF